MNSFFELNQTQSVIGLGTLASLVLPDNYVSLVVLGPGNGESLLLKLPSGEFVVIDSFLRPKTSAGLCPVLELLDQLGGHLAGAILTHPHADHAEGFDRIVGRCQGPIGVVEKFLPISGDKWDTVTQQRKGLTESALNAVRDRWEADSTTQWSLQTGENRTFGEVTLTVLHPDTDSVAGLSGYNQLSSPILLEWNSLRLILGADLPTEQWSTVNSSYGIGNHQGMKLPHHASKEGFHVDIHGPGSRDRLWLATPYKRSPHPPRFEEGEGVDLILSYVDRLYLTSVLFETPSDLPNPAPRTALLDLAAKSTKTIRLPGAPTAVPVVDPKDPNSSWIAASWANDGELLSIQKGKASVVVSN